MGRLQRLTLAGIVVGAAALRFSTLGLQSLDFDEAYTVGIVGGSLGHAFHQIPLTESTPPLYYVLQWLWSQLFGVGAIGLRALSALLGTLTVGAAFLAGRRLAGVGAGLAAALLVAVNPLMVWYSQEARSYALLALLCTLSVWAFACALEAPSPRALIGWAAASAAALATHYFAGFLVIVEAVWLLWRWRGAVRPVALAVGAVALVGASLVPLLSEQASRNHAQWIESLSLPARLREVGKKWLTGEIVGLTSAEVILFLASLGGLLWIALRHAGARQRRGAAVAGGLAAGVLMLSLAVELGGGHYLISKNELPALTVLLIAAGAALAGGRTGVAAQAVVVACFLALTVAVDLTPAMQRADYRGAAAAIGPRVPDEAVVTPRLGDAPIAVYRPGAVPLPEGWPVRVIVVARPAPRADEPARRPITPAPPAGFRLAGRRDAETFTLICFLSADGRPRPERFAGLAALGGPAGFAQTWPRARETAVLPNVCRS